MGGHPEGDLYETLPPCHDHIPSVYGHGMVVVRISSELACVHGNVES